MTRRNLARPAVVAEFLDVTEKTLENWRAQETGPPFIRINGRLVRYDMDAVEAWLADRAVTTY